MADITTAAQLREYMTAPTDGVLECVGKVKGDIVVLGGSGKMGPELTEMILRADAIAGMTRTITVASTFSNPKERTAERFADLGVRVRKGELTDTAFLDSLPEAANVIYMPGFKFGSSGNWEKAVHVNSILPYLVGEKYRRSRIVVFSSANPYAPTTPATGGSREESPLDPQGVYGWSIVARESAFVITARRHPEQRSCFYRLAYAQHLAYGVVVDLALAILRGEEISLGIPFVNLISQRDANDRAIRALELCANPPTTLNVSGPAVSVRDLAVRLGLMLGRQPVLVGAEPEQSLIINDEFSLRRFGPYQDTVDDILTAVVAWVRNSGEYWGKPTKFGEVKREY